MTNNRRQLDCEEDDLDRFSYLNVAAVVLPLLLLAVVYMGVEKQERVNDGEVDMDVGSGGSQARPMGADGRVFAPGSRPKVTCDTAGVLDRHSDRAETRREVPKHERVNDANSKGHQAVGGHREVPNPPTSQGAQECTPPLHFPLRPRPCAGGSPNACRLFDAIRRAESGGNDRAVGDSWRSVGPYQCGRAAWLDGGGKAADYPQLAYDRAATEAVMLRYWARYGAVTDEAKSRCWNSGPAWKSKYHLTNNYWAKVKKELVNAND